MKKKIRAFKTGSTRDTNNGKLEYARFFDPHVLRTFAEYMHKHRKQSDGELRDPDNWKKGMPRQVYMDSLMRHVYDLWEIHDYGVTHRHEDGHGVSIGDALCGIIFNAMGYLYEVLRGRSTK